MDFEINRGLEEVAVQLRERPNILLETQGNKSLAAINRTTLAVLGDPWAKANVIRPFAKFQVRAVLSEGQSWPLTSSIVVKKDIDGHVNLRVIPSNPRSLTIVVPVYHPDLVELELSLKSILSSLQFSAAADYEIFVVDDGSVNGIRAIDELILRLKVTFDLSGDELVIWHRPQNMGVAAARNFGFEKSNKDFVFFIDGDDEVHPWYFALMFTELSSGADFVSTSMRLSTDQIFCADDRPLSALMLQNGNGCGIGIRRSSFLREIIGRELYNTRNQLHYEDWELNIVARLRGVRVANVNAPLYYYRIKRSGRNSKHQSFQLYSYLTTPLNALQTAMSPNETLAVKEILPYMEQLMSYLKASAHVPVPERKFTRIGLCYRAFLFLDQAISEKMYISRLLNYVRRKWRKNEW